MFLTAPLIHDGNGFLKEGSVLEITEEGTVIAIHDDAADQDVLRHEGILCPGFVNVHCHLELSHMKDMVPRHTGLIPFLQQIPAYRNQFTNEQIKAARHEAYQELLRNGVVALGDIANVTDTTDVRSLGQMHIHTFVECIGFTEAHARQRFDHSYNVYETFAAQQDRQAILRQSIVPHAPYSVSKDLFDLIDKFQPHALLSVHNQEADAENEYYSVKTGAVKQLLAGFGIDDSFFTPTGSGSLPAYTSWLNAHHPMIFVHNTVSTAADIAIAAHRFQTTSWCLCPNANLYIENRLPDVQQFIDAGVNICVGTDSLASNSQLCILTELYTLKQHMPQLDWELLLQWGTRNGALALQMSDTIGTIHPGKKPGFLNITFPGGPEAKPVVRRLV